MRWDDVSTHSRLKAAGDGRTLAEWIKDVSTHSRLKAAGSSDESGRVEDDAVSTHSRLKAAGEQPRQEPHKRTVSTHSRLKAAGYRGTYEDKVFPEFQHTAA